MRMSELAERSGTPIASIKYYIREGMLPRGEATSATRAEYDETHLARLRLIHALADVRALPLTRVKEILDLVDAPAPSAYETLGRAIGALPPYVDAEDAPRARETIQALGMVYDERFAAVAQLGAAIRALDAAGLPWSADVAARYYTRMREIARDELTPLPALAPGERVAYAVLGTALYEPAMLALRRLAHQNLLIESGRADVPDAAEGTGAPDRGVGTLRA